MKLYVILISATILCLALYLSSHTKYFKQDTNASNVEPLFEDLIITEEIASYDQKEISDEEWPVKDLQVLNTLKSKLSRSYESPKIIEYASTIPTNVSDSEIKHYLKKASEFRKNSKNEKALKMIENAVLKAPNNADILNFYGEILETTNNDYITANQYYDRALLVSPDHEGALVNRQRTAYIVEQHDLKIFKTIDEKRDILKNLHNSDPLFQKFKKQAYYLHIYHTVGIEGNTMTIEQMRYLLETGRAVYGKSIIEHNEILGLQLAMKYVKLLTRKKTIELNDILGIHRRVLGHVDPLNSGQFRNEQVYVSTHIPPKPEDVSDKMREFVEWLNSEEAINQHPVRYAALSHYKFTDIHPFTDGNGRTSRLLVNLILLRAGYPPVIILKEQRPQYYDCLKIANQGDVRPFVRFIAQCTEDALDLYLWGAQEFSTYANIEDFSENTISL